MMHVIKSQKTAILGKPGSYIMEKIFSAFLSVVLRLLFLSAAFYFSGAVTNNDPLLQLQHRSAGSLHVAFGNLCDSQS